MCNTPDVATILAKQQEHIGVYEAVIKALTRRAAFEKRADELTSELRAGLLTTDELLSMFQEKLEIEKGEYDLIKLIGEAEKNDS